MIIFPLEKRGQCACMCMCVRVSVCMCTQVHICLCICVCAYVYMWVMLQVTVQCWSCRNNTHEWGLLYTLQGLHAKLYDESVINMTIFHAYPSLTKWVLSVALFKNEGAGSEKQTTCPSSRSFEVQTQACQPSETTCESATQFYLLVIITMWLKSFINNDMDA